MFSNDIELSFHHFEAWLIVNIAPNKISWCNFKNTLDQQRRSSCPVGLLATYFADWDIIETIIKQIKSHNSVFERRRIFQLLADGNSTARARHKSSLCACASSFSLYPGIGRGKVGDSAIQIFINLKHLLCYKYFAVILSYIHRYRNNQFRYFQSDEWYHDIIYLTLPQHDC